MSSIAKCLRFINKRLLIRKKISAAGISAAMRDIQTALKRTQESFGKLAGFVVERQRQPCAFGGVFDY
jgi:hypothetical protein